MTAVPTTNKQITKLATGDNVGTWAATVDLNWDAIDAALGGVLPLTLTNSNVTLTSTTTSAVGQSANLLYLLTGTLTANVTVTFPAVGGLYAISNGTSGAFTVTIACAGAGTSVVVPQGRVSLVVSDGVNIAFADEHLAPKILPPPRGHLGGLTLSNDVTTPNSVVDIGTGSATSDDQSAYMTLAAAMTKTIAGTWVVGTGNGGLDTGTAAPSTWLHAFLIQRPDTGVVDVLFSVSATAPTMPTNYTKKRRIGAVYLDSSSHIVPFSQNGDEFLWLAAGQDVNGAVPAAGSSYVLSVPSGIKVNALIDGYFGTNVSAYILITAIDQTNKPANSSFFTASVGPSAQLASINMSVRTDLTCSIRIRASTGGTTTVINTRGWIDARGRFD